MIEFLFISFMLGVGLAMDACAVSMANGFAEPKMKLKKIVLIALMFGFFQGFMPLIGYFIGASILTYIQKFIPYIALVLLSYCGINMIVEAIKELKENKVESKNEETSLQIDENKKKTLTFKGLFIQSIATSIDALSVGFSISNYSVAKALFAALIICVITFIISFVFMGITFFLVSREIRTAFYQILIISFIFFATRVALFILKIKGYGTSRLERRDN